MVDDFCYDNFYAKNGLFNKLNNLQSFFIINASQLSTKVDTFG